MLSTGRDQNSGLPVLRLYAMTFNGRSQSAHMPRCSLVTASRAASSSASGSACFSSHTGASFQSPHQRVLRNFHSSSAMYGSQS
ncbi:hypothetical protein ES705_48102 [subsurface metagenome]